MSQTLSGFFFKVILSALVSHFCLLSNFNPMAKIPLIAVKAESQYKMWPVWLLKVARALLAELSIHTTN